MNLSIACSTCRVTMIEGGGDAIGWSIFAMLIVIVAMLGGISFFMIRMVRRGDAELDPSLRDEYVRPEPSR